MTAGEETLLILHPVKDENVLDLGDEMPGFTLADIDGNVHSLGLLLDRYDVVVLTFFRTSSAQSVTNLINLQAAYEIYGDRVAVLALDPADRLQMEVSMFRDLHGLTYPVALCDKKLADSLGVVDFPTTVIVDREGKISMIHSGIIDRQDYAAVFEHFLTADYVHTPIRSIDELMGRRNKKY